MLFRSITASARVFKRLINESVIRGVPTKSNNLFPHFNMASVIKLYGSIHGYVIYSMDNHVAHKLTSDLLYGMPIPNHSLLIKSAMGEITNMICGEAIKIFEEEYHKNDISLSVPMFIPDADKKIYKQNVTAINVPLTTSYGIVALSLGFEANDDNQIDTGRKQ